MERLLIYVRCLQFHSISIGQKKLTVTLQQKVAKICQIWNAAVQKY